MHDRARAQAWRTAALALAGGWVVLACGGGDDDRWTGAARSSVSPRVEARAGTAPGTAPAERAAAGGVPSGAAAPGAVPPCASGAAGALARSALQVLIDAEFDVLVQTAMAQPTGTVEAADPFDEH